MIKFIGLSTAAAALIVASPAGAAWKEVRVNAVVTEVTHPAGADGVKIGDTATMRAVFNDSNLVDVTDLINPQFGGNAKGIRGVSLSDPGASFELRFRDDVFTQAFGQGQDLYGNGVAYPILFYLGDVFWGFSVLGQRPDGFGVGLYSEAEISLGLPPVLVGGFGCCFAFGEESFKGTVDIAGAKITDAVPEPTTWAMLIAGFGVIGVVTRRRRAAAMYA
jgi:PEP-CTERM motif